MKKVTKLLLGIALVPFLWFAVACEQTSVSEQQPLAQTVSPPSALRPVLPPPAQLTWPFLGQAQNESEVAPDLLADNYMLVLDGSGSMNYNACGQHTPKIKIAKEAIRAWIATVPDEANLGLIIFDETRLSERLPLGKGEDNRKLFLKKVDGSAAGGGTPLHSAVKLAYQRLTTQGRKQLGYGQYRLIVVTDGDPDALEDPRFIVDQITRESPVAVDTIGFCIGANHALNRPGKTTYREASDSESLRKGLQQVSGESLTYTDLSNFQQLLPQP